jgi:hypothetical protein
LQISAAWGQRAHARDEGVVPVAVGVAIPVGGDRDALVHEAVAVVVYAVADLDGLRVDVRVVGRAVGVVRRAVLVEIRCARGESEDQGEARAHLGASRAPA